MKGLFEYSTLSMYKCSRQMIPKNFKPSTLIKFFVSVSNAIGRDRAASVVAECLALRHVRTERLFGRSDATHGGPDPRRSSPEVVQFMRTGKSVATIQEKKVLFYNPNVNLTC